MKDKTIIGLAILTATFGAHAQDADTQNKDDKSKDLKQIYTQQEDLTVDEEVEIKILEHLEEQGILIEDLTIQEIEELQILMKKIVLRDRLLINSSIRCMISPDAASTNIRCLSAERKLEEKLKEQLNQINQSFNRR